MIIGIVNNWLVGTYGTQEVFEKILLWPFICRIFVDFLGKRKYIFDMHNSMDIFSMWLTLMLFSYTKHIGYIILHYNYYIGRNSGLGTCTSFEKKVILRGTKITLDALMMSSIHTNIYNLLLASIHFTTLLFLIKSSADGNIQRLNCSLSYDQII